MINKFEAYLEKEGKSKNTIKSYLIHINGFLKWFSETYSIKFTRLYRENVLEYKSYLKNIKKQSAKTLNVKIAALIKFNEFLQEINIQEDIVISKKDTIKIQTVIANPTSITKKDVEQFRQHVLESEGKRNYAIVTIMAYAGLRISETLNIKIDDFNLVSREIIIRSGKGEKQRIVYMNDKVVNVIKEYLKIRDEKGKYLFMSQKGNKLDRTVINRMFKKYSNNMTPHTLRHFFCTNALENGFSIHEVANLAGHTNIHTTLLYTNPSVEKMKEKMNKL
nr:tyrosine-type recombinase/integrase [Anaerophilus nitritogenes]